MASIKPPAPRPCESCPYRRDVPSGVWAPEEYAKLLDYDKLTGEQPTQAFLCHQQNGRVCAGWLGCHLKAPRGRDLLSLRFLFRSSDDWLAMEEILDYKSPVPLFSSSREAAEHGLTEVDNPDYDAARIINKIVSHRAQEDA